MDNNELSQLIMQRRRQYLVHCFLYYELDNAIISDEQYWKFCNELIKLQIEHGDLCNGLPYHDICKDLDTSYTRPKSYPEEIKQVAYRLIAIHENKSLIDVVRGYGLTIKENA